MKETGVNKSGSCHAAAADCCHVEHGLGVARSWLSVARSSDFSQEARDLGF